jgi:hypothetical protein
VNPQQARNHETSSLSCSPAFQKHVRRLAVGKRRPTSGPVGATGADGSPLFRRPVPSYRWHLLFCHLFFEVDGTSARYRYFLHPRRILSPPQYLCNNNSIILFSEKVQTSWYQN